MWAAIRGWRLPFKTEFTLGNWADLRSCTFFVGWKRYFHVSRLHRSISPPYFMPSTLDTAWSLRRTRSLAFKRLRALILLAKRLISPVDETSRSISSHLAPFRTLWLGLNFVPVDWTSMPVGTWWMWTADEARLICGLSSMSDGYIWILYILVINWQMSRWIGESHPSLRSRQKYQMRHAHDIFYYIERPNEFCLA